MKKQKVLDLIDERIKENKKHFGKRGYGRSYEVCWLCFEDPYCEHEIRIKELKKLRKQIEDL